MHSLIPVDKNGVPLANMITWADLRSADIAERIRASGNGEDIYRKTGTPIHPMSPLCKIIWLRENDKDLFSSTHKFISIKELIWFRLFNEFKIDISIASATGLFDIETNLWYTKSLELAGIYSENLSTPVSTGYSRNDCNASLLSLLNITADVSFIIGASDGCLANVGSFAVNKDEAAVTIGTSAAVRLMSKTPIYNYDAMTFNYKLDEHTFICGGALNNGGNVVQWFLKNFPDKKVITNEDYENLFHKVEKVNAGADGLIFLPYLNGERAPHWDAKSCGTFFGVTAQHSQLTFSRAIIEGICYALNDVLKTIETGGHTISQLTVSGGFVASKIWMQILADITGKRVCIIQSYDASATGAAYLGLKTMNFIEGYTELPKTNMEFLEPGLSNHKMYNNYFTIFRGLYHSLKDSMHALHNLNH
ncbi:MAG: gluconokinase [Chitinophagaceae bacterium]|nr:gluconokinase [Chitinophagaceae bacterium]